MTTKYVCGGCTACCTTHGVTEIKKPPREKCSLCKDHGCSIYEARPKTCQDFECLWLLGNAGGPDQRPDILGIVPTYVEHPELGLILVLTEFRPGALCSEIAFQWTLNNAKKGGLTLHSPFGGNKRYYLPEGAGADGDFTETIQGQLTEFILFSSLARGLVL